MSSAQVSALIAAARRDRAKKLDLSGQKLTELPDSIGELAHLTHLDLKHNNLNSLPDSIGNLHQLTELYLHSNDIDKLPQSISKLTQLKVLVIHLYYLIISSFCHYSQFFEVPLS